MGLRIIYTQKIQCIVLIQDSFKSQASAINTDVPFSTELFSLLRLSCLMCYSSMRNICPSDQWIKVYLGSFNRENFLQIMTYACFMKLRA